MASYCRNRIHLALAEELNKIVEAGDLGEKTDNFDLKREWERAFTSCFRKVDEECDLIGPDTNGTTALIAVVTSSHVIVANCGHSRAVLSRGKKAVPLSVDHKVIKPKRAGEYERINAEGGSFVIDQISMSRSIGDRYLKPWIIPVPEITILPRARDDDCLILATDGLWDVVSNQTASDLARKRIMVCRKRGEKLMQTSEENIEFDGCDKGTESAAVALAKRAIRKGSGDNVTVVVVDMKAKWKFKGNP